MITKVVAALVLVLSSALVSAASVDINVSASNRGYITSSGDYSFGDGTNYFTSPDDGFRSYFIFNLVDLAGFNVTAARLELYNTGGGYVGGNGSGTLTMRAVSGSLNLVGAPTMTYADLGDGTVYGSTFTSSPANTGSYVVITLNADFLSAMSPKIGNGAIGLGAALEDATPAAYLFGWSGGISMADTRLVLTGSYAPVPEPSTYGLALGGLVLVGAVIRRRRKT